MKSLTIIGNLGSDAEKVANGSSIMFTVAVPQIDTSKKPDWFRCFGSEEVLKNVFPYLKKGSHVVVAGQLYFKEYEGKQTNNINVDFFEFIPSARKGSGSKIEEQQAEQETPAQPFLKRKKSAEEGAPF